MCNAQNSLPLALFTQLLIYDSQPESVTKARKRHVIFNKEIRRCNASAVQKLTGPSIPSEIKREISLLLLEVAKGILALGTNFKSNIFLGKISHTDCNFDKC